MTVLHRSSPQFCHFNWQSSWHIFQVQQSSVPMPRGQQQKPNTYPVTHVSVQVRKSQKMRGRLTCRSLRQISRCSSPAPATMCSPVSSMEIWTMGSDLDSRFRPSTSLGRSCACYGQDTRGNMSAHGFRHGSHIASYFLSQNFAGTARFLPIMVPAPGPALQIRNGIVHPLAPK